MLLSTKDTHILKNCGNYEWIADDELSRFNTRIVRLKRLRFDRVPMQAGTAGGPREEMVGLDRLVEEALIREAKDEWERELDRQTAKRGEGGNKLRTYALIKSEICFEPYLVCVFDQRKRALLFKFRSGIAPLRIETGRYEYIHKVRLRACERICLCCADGVEDELHFLSVCPTYSKERVELIKACMTFNDNQPDGSARINCDDPRDFFINIMSTKDYSLNKCLADYVWNEFKTREARRSLMRSIFFSFLFTFN